MVSLVLYQPLYRQSLEYELDDVQSQFSALPSRWFDDTTACKVVILHDDKAVGFFVLDDGDDKYDYTDNPKALLLRSMSINPAHQGQGLATLGLQNLTAFCQTYCAKFDQIVLGVHHKNIAAQKLYAQAGFVKTERIFMGIKGKQYVYEMWL